MTGKHRIVVSAENTAYGGWQAKLFYYSCVTRIGYQPTIVVHQTGGEWHPAFHDLARAGAQVIAAPSYIQSGDEIYLVRNAGGTLLEAASFCRPEEMIVLCDPDMIFLDALQFPATRAAEYCSYLDYQRPRVAIATAKLGIAAQRVREQESQLCCGVPYVVPASEARAFAQVWLEAIDAFRPHEWEDAMYAFGLALVKLGLSNDLTHMVQSNLEPGAPAQRAMVHYCYGDEHWNKRHFVEEQDAAKVWQPAISAEAGTVLGEMLAQIKEAASFYEDPYRQAPASDQAGGRAARA
jgi:hypothetical protein